MGNQDKSNEMDQGFRPFEPISVGHIFPQSSIDSVCEEQNRMRFAICVINR